jgi:hypothetical protein
MIRIEALDSRIIALKYIVTSMTDQSLLQDSFYHNKMQRKTFSNSEK